MTDTDTPRTYLSERSAIAAAKKALGPQAKKSVDFKLVFVADPSGTGPLCSSLCSWAPIRK